MWFVMNQNAILQGMTSLPFVPQQVFIGHPEGVYFWIGPLDRTVYFLWDSNIFWSPSNRYGHKIPFWDVV